MIKSILYTKTFRQSVTTVISTLINGLLGAAFYILLARFLGPADFGILIVAVSVLTLLADIVDLGTNTGIVRFVSLHISSDKAKALRFLKLGLEIKLFFWVIVLVLGVLLSPIIASGIFQKQELDLPLKLAMVGVGGSLLLTFSTSALQALEKFKTWGVVNIGANLIRLTGLLILIGISQLTVASGLILYIVIPFLAFIVSLSLLPVNFLKAKDESKLFPEFFKFNRFIALSILFSAVSSRLDTFLNAKFLSANDVGIYGAASQLNSFIPQVISALGVVAAPKFSQFDTREKMMSYLKKFQLLVTAIAVAGILLLPLANIFIPVFFGVKYTASIPIFMIIFLSMMLFLISIPIRSSITYYYGKPYVSAIASALNFFLTLALGVYLIPKYGVSGTALTILISYIFNLIVSVGFFLKLVKNKKTAFNIRIN